ncbi:hypothetical protein [Secundilactobacillus collinoides]|uniref:hypothetical protein n=1 Tax=Secundilactobacillus collinoides TaxID=33960 RepID=UPI0006D0A146|nr:hypothetical protein [Secundilactobacillus collinoides]
MTTLISVSVRLPTQQTFATRESQVKLPSNFKKNMKLTTELDERLVQLRLNEACVAYCLAHTDQETLTIIDELYFKRHSALTLEGLGQQLHLSKSCISKRRAQFMMLLADQLGLSSSMSY